MGLRERLRRLEREAERANAPTPQSPNLRRIFEGGRMPNRPQPGRCVQKARRPRGRSAYRADARTGGRHLRAGRVRPAHRREVGEGKGRAGPASRCGRGSGEAAGRAVATVRRAPGPDPCPGARRSREIPRRISRGPGFSLYLGVGLVGVGPYTQNKSPKISMTTTSRLGGTIIRSWTFAQRYWSGPTGPRPRWEISLVPPVLVVEGVEWPSRRFLVVCPC